MLLYFARGAANSWSFYEIFSHVCSCRIIPENASLSAVQTHVFVQHITLSVRLGMCPTLLATRWPFSLGISNLHNLCWLPLTGLSRRLCVWLKTQWNCAGCQKQKSPLMRFVVSSEAKSFFTNQCTKSVFYVFICLLVSCRMTFQAYLHFMKYHMLS